MASESRTSAGSGRWTLLLGPGGDLEDLVPFIQALIIVPSNEEAPPLRQLEDLDGLLSDFPEFGRLVLDTGRLLREDVGLVRSFLARRPSWELVLFGDDPTGAASRTLLSLGRVRFLPSPLNVAGLRDICSDPVPLQERIPERGLSPAPSEPFDPEPAQGPVLETPDEDEENLAPELLDRVGRILSGESLSVEPPPSRPVVREPASSVQLAYQRAPTTVGERRVTGELLGRVQPGQSEALLEATELEEPATRVDAPPLLPAPYFKNQVADLADIVQCVDLTLGMAREETKSDNGAAASNVARRLDELSGEVARLRQFTRTLSFLAAPPIAGNQRFELAPMLEEMLISRRGEPDAPRYLLRTQDPLVVRSDKRLLAQVFDAVLFLSHHSAGPDGTVRVDGRVRGERVSISIRFPAGPFVDVDPTKILEPYALRRSLPELGANALAAAAGIMRGQGGALELRAEDGGGLEWLATLPACP